MVECFPACVKTQIKTYEQINKRRRDNRRGEERQARRRKQGNGEVICQLLQSLHGYDFFLQLFDIFVHVYNEF